MKICIWIEHRSSMYIIESKPREAIKPQLWLITRIISIVCRWFLDFQMPRRVDHSRGPLSLDFGPLFKFSRASPKQLFVFKGFLHLTRSDPNTNGRKSSTENKNKSNQHLQARWDFGVFRWNINTPKTSEKKVKTKKPKLQTNSADVRCPMLA